MSIVYFPPKGQKKVRANEFSITELGLGFSISIPQLDKLEKHGFLRKMKVDQYSPDNKPFISTKTFEQWQENPNPDHNPSAQPTKQQLEAAAKETKELVENKDILATPIVEKVIEESKENTTPESKEDVKEDINVPSKDDVKEPIKEEVVEQKEPAPSDSEKPVVRRRRNSNK